MKKYKIIEELLLFLINGNLCFRYTDKYKTKNMNDHLLTLHINKKITIFLMCMEKVEFDDNLYNKLEKAIKSSAIIDMVYVVSIKLFQKAIFYNPSRENFIYFYRYLGIHGWECESIILKGLLFEKKYDEIKKFVAQHEFATIRDSFFLDSCIWNGVDYEQFLIERNIDFKVESSIGECLALFP